MRHRVVRTQAAADAAPEAATSMVVPVLGAVVLNACMGSMYTWSIFLAAFEGVLGLPRAQLSLVFSTAMGTFAAVMFGGAKLHTWMSTPKAAFLAMAQAGIGLLVAGFSSSYLGLVGGFGVIYGASVGIGYGIALGAANQATVNKGLITGIVVAAFATTPVFLAPVLKGIISTSGPSAALKVLGATILALSPVVYACLRVGKVQIPPPEEPVCPVEWEDDKVQGQCNVPFSTLAKIWLGFGLGSLGGLMVFAHAAGVITTFGGNAAQVVQGVQLCAFGNWTGRILAGLGSDKFGPKAVLAAAAASTAAALLTLQTFFQGNCLAATVALVVTGVGFGSSLTAYPVLTRKMVTSGQFGALFGKVFTGFGVAAFVGPVLAGSLFDAFATYSATLYIATATCVLSLAVLASLPAYVE